MPRRNDPLNINICRPIWSESQSGGLVLYAKIIDKRQVV